MFRYANVFWLLMLFLSCLARPAFAEAIIFPAPEGVASSSLWQVEVEKQNVFCYPDYRLNPAFPKTLHKMKVSEQAFAIFDFTGTVTVRATLKEGALPSLAQCVIRPMARGIQPRIDGNVIEFNLDQPGDITLDPDGSGLHVLHLFTNAPETDIPDPDDPNVVYFGPGVHDIEDLELKAGQTLYLAGRAVLRPLPTQLRRPGKDRHYTKVDYERGVAAIRAKGDNITIRGRGIISGERGLPAGRRFGLFQGSRMKNLRMEGVTLTRSSGWTLLLYDARDSRLERVRILGYFTNSDGICLHSCNDCIVTDCFIHTADDCYEVKSKGNNILFENSQVWCDAGTAMGVTHEIDGLVENVTWRNMTVLHYTYRFNPYEGITSRGAIHIHPAMGGTIDGLRFEDITVENISTDRPLICIYNVKKPKEGKHFFPDQPYSAIRNVSFKNIQAMHVQNPEILLYDESGEGLLHDITFENVVINRKKLQAEDSRLNLKGGVKEVTVK